MSQVEYTKEERMQIANTIIQQLGGPGRLTAMAGCKDFTAIDAGVQFGIGRNAAGINKAIIKLRADDTYDVEFGTVRMNRKTFECTWTVKDKTEGAYADMLKSLFERATGMYLTF
jgi:hypothetical protein